MTLDIALPSASSQFPWPVIRCPHYADVRILQKPFDWRRVDQQVTIERVADERMPFEGKNGVLLGNLGAEPTVDVNHVTGATLSLVGTKGFYAPVDQVNFET